MQNSFIRFLAATALVAVVISASSLRAAVFLGTAYDGFDYAVDNLITQPAPAPSGSVGLNGGTGWTQPWGVTLSDNNTIVGSRAALGVVSTPAAPSTQQQIVGGGLSYPGLASSGGALQLTGLTSGNSPAVGRFFGQAVDTGTFYFSYLVQKNTETTRTTNFQLFGSTGAATQPNERLSIGQVASNVNFLNATGNLYNAGPSNPLVVPPIVGTDQANKGDFQVLYSNPLAGGTIYNSTKSSTNSIIERNVSTNPNNVPVQSFTLNQTFMVVGKIEFNVSGVDDRLTLYLNPTDLTAEGANTAYFTVTGVDFGILTGFRAFAGNQQSTSVNGITPNTVFPPVTAIYDEIHFGTTFNDVTTIPVPEPSTVMLGMSALGFFFFFRRFQRRRI